MESDVSVAGNVGIGSISTTEQEKATLALASQSFECPKCGFHAKKFDIHLQSVEQIKASKQKSDQEPIENTGKLSAEKMKNSTELDIEAAALPEPQSEPIVKNPENSQPEIPKDEPEIVENWQVSRRETPLSFSLTFTPAPKLPKLQTTIPEPENPQQNGDSSVNGEYNVYNFHFLNDAKMKLAAYQTIASKLVYQNKGIEELNRNKKAAQAVGAIEMVETISWILVLAALAYFSGLLMFNSFSS